MSESFTKSIKRRLSRHSRNTSTSSTKSSKSLGSRSSENLPTISAPILQEPISSPTSPRLPTSEIHASPPRLPSPFEVDEESQDFGTPLLSGEASPNNYNSYSLPATRPLPPTPPRSARTVRITEPILIVQKDWRSEMLQIANSYSSMATNTDSELGQSCSAEYRTLVNFIEYAAMNERQALAALRAYVDNLHKRQSRNRYQSLDSPH